MIGLTFTSELGSIRMGGAGFFGPKILEITGLGFTAPERTTKVYNNSRGSRCTSRHIPERTITISGEISTENLNRTKAKEDMIRAAGVPGVIEIDCGIKRRYIKAEVNKLEFGEKNKVYQKFTIQFICEENVFYSSLRTRTISTVTKNISGSFTLPRVLSYRYNKADIYNPGDYEIEPVIKIYDLGERDVEEYSGSVVIRNNTTGSFVELLRTTKDGEVITVDIPERRIRSSLEDEDLYCFSDDSVLSDFIFGRGNTEFEVINNTNREISCFLEYRELFSECEL